MTQGWHDWEDDPPPKGTVVLAHYGNELDAKIVKTCNNGCCVFHDGLAMTLPRYWRPMQ